ncbi:C2 family cysteine protease, partial [Trichormus sp. NMC-1]|uniref:C2 family cysteine protease n=1 Tax=Trichormus sp. NMC-1 TaxID=1853259 RepID=UPI000A527703
QLSTSDRNNPTLSGRYSDDYRLTGLSAGQQIRLDMTSSFDTYLQLVNESTGQVIAENDDSNGTRNSQINLTVQAGVSYIARATSYSSGVTGNYNISLTGSQVSDWFDQNIRDTELRSEIRNRMTDGSLDRNDMIAIFRNARDGSTIDGNELTDLRTLVNNTDRISMQEPVRVLSRKIANGNIANGRAGIGNLVASSSSSQMDRLIDKWFLGTIRPTTTNSNFTYRFASGSLFQNGISQDDVRQSTALNNCYFMAGLATTALRQSNTIQNMFIDNGDGTFTVRFYDVTNQVADYVTVDKYLPVDTYGRFVYANRGSLHNDQNNELWVALAEKAYAQFNESDTTNQIGRNNNDRNSYYGIEWGFANVALTNITGSRSNSFSDFNLNGLLNQINAARPIIVNSKSSGVLPSIVPSHSYTLTSYDSQTQKFRLFNPRVGSTQPRNIDMIIEQLRLYFSGWIYI